MVDLLVVALAAALVYWLIAFDVAGDVTGILMIKPVASALFVVAALIHPPGLPSYAPWIVAGLVLCLVGDVCLAFPSDRMFLAGLVAFLSGHLFYAAALFQVSPLNIGSGAAAAAALAAGAGIFIWLRPGLGAMEKPVIAYIAVISLMVIGAGTVAADCRLTATGRFLVLAGAVSFYLSDIFVARQRFVVDAAANRRIGLPLYYAGQFMIAFSVARLAAA